MGLEAKQGLATTSVLFTDLVDSTALRSRLGDEAADEVRRMHDEALTAVIASAGGVVVKSLGDGLMAVFAAAADAVGAAIGCQQAVTAMDGPAGESLLIRVGISVGDVAFEDEDCHGSTVNEAARLCSAAQGGQILAADLVRAMARGRGGFLFESVGELELKGLAAPVAASMVGWEPLPPEVAVAFPPALKPPNPGDYVGRDDVRSVLAGLWDDTKNVGARTALLVGDPGIGKTRTAYEVARAAHDEGAVVLFGRCDAELRVPYQPFVEALEWQHRHGPHLSLGRLGGELTRLVPDLAEGRSGLGAPVVSDPRTEEHRLFEATASWLCAAASDSGLVLVLDDLHWATKPTLLMLLHAVRAAAVDDVKLLVIGTYRDTDLDRAHPLSAVLGDLRHIDGVHRVPIDPLDHAEVVEYLEQTAGHLLDDDGRVLAKRVYDETAGNPFFVSEVLSHLIETGAVRFAEGRWVVPDPDRVDVPEGVRDVVGQRLSRLSDTVNEALRAAAVIGRDFDVDLVAALAGVDEDMLLDAFDEASRARLIEETDVDRFRFTHALVRTTLYDELSVSRRRRMHRRVVDLLAERPVADLAALAHHSVAAGPRDGDLSQAIGYVIAAGERSQAARAHGEAETYFAKAVELLDEDDQPDTALRVGVLISLGETRRDQGDPTFRETLLDASRLAITIGADGLLMRAALANTRVTGSILSDVDTERVDILEAALERSTSATPGDQARLLATFASELVFDACSTEQRLYMSDRVIAIATATETPELTAFVLNIAFSTLAVPQRWTQRLVLAETAVAAADATSNPTAQIVARIGLVRARLGCADLVAAAACMHGTGHLVDRGASPLVEVARQFYACQFLAYEGRFDDALAAVDDALAAGERIGMVDAPAWWFGITNGIAEVRGRPHHRSDQQDGRADQWGAFADQYPRLLSVRAAHIAALAEAGRLDESRATLEHHRLGNPTLLPPDRVWMTSMYSLATTAQVLEDAELGRDLITLLEPHDSAGIHTGAFLYGTVEVCRARAAAAQGLIDDSIVHLRNELEWARSNSPVFATSAAIELAEQLIERHGPGDHDEARTLLHTAQPEADRMTMHGWLQRADTALTATGSS